jgi:acyl-CoA reductase-like NAD-dependent aldehyde dehydrogenase
MTETVKLKSPIDGSIYAERPVFTHAQVSKAVETARQRSRVGRRLPSIERAKYMLAMLERSSA